jgi:LysM repeat protein
MPEICPFLAATHDLDSVLNYPSEGNVCTRLGEANPVATSHQAGYCLRARYWFCPVYTGAIKQPPTPIAFEEPLPVESPRPLTTLIPEMENVLAVKSITSESALPGRTARSRRSVLVRPREALAALVILTAVGLGAEYLSTNLQHQLINSGGSISATATASPTVTASPNPTKTLTLTSTASLTFTVTASATITRTFTPTATITPSPTVTQTPTVTNTPGTPKPCIAPPDWGSYTIQPGETYFHIATKFGTTVEILQEVNCLADPQRVLSGQILHVPPAPPPSATVALTLTSTATPTAH